jgi:uncharacterized protein YvpB
MIGLSPGVSMKRTSDVQKLFFVFIIMAVSLPVYAAELYKWVDKEGVIHFSDEQPEGAKDLRRIRIYDSDRAEDISPKKLEAPGETKPTLPQKSAKDPRRVHSRTQQKLENFPLVIQKHNWCVIASMEMIYRYYGNDVDQDMIFQKFKGRKSRVREGEGLDDRTAARFLSRSGFNVDHREGGNLETVKKYIDNNVPVMWGHIAPGKWEGSRHMSVIIGYDDIYGTIVVADPSCGCELSISYHEFKDWWGRARNVMIAVAK